MLKTLLVIYIFQSNFDSNYPNNIKYWESILVNLSKHKSILLNSLLTKINSIKHNYVRINSSRRKTKHITLVTKRTYSLNNWYLTLLYRDNLRRKLIAFLHNFISDKSFISTLSLLFWIVILKVKTNYWNFVVSKFQICIQTKIHISVNTLLSGIVVKIIVKSFTGCEGTGRTLRLGGEPI
jgi:hypothetical protein